MTLGNKTSRFVEFLEGMADRRDRGALASLRRGLGQPPGATPEMHPYVARWAGGESTRWREDVHYLVAALFAHHPMRWPREESSGWTNLGTSFARIATGDNHDSVERRFTALLNVRREEDLHIHLRHAISLLKSREQPVDWARLLDDLKSWGHEDRWVQRNWARAFWDRADQGDTDPNASE